MCGIIGAVSNRDVTDILIDGLKKLEYRGYDSAGLAVLDRTGGILRVRVQDKVDGLAELASETGVTGSQGIAHTRWATHGEPSEANAHPHMSGPGLALIHNGIIENYESLREALQAQGYEFQSATDSEVAAHLVHSLLVTNDNDPLRALMAAVDQMEGAWGMGLMLGDRPGELFACRSGSPLIIGLGQDENFIASDVGAIIEHTNKVIYLEEGDFAHITQTDVTIYDAKGKKVDRPVQKSAMAVGATDKGNYAHYMLKEIHEQGPAIARTLEGRIGDDHVLGSAFGPKALAVLAEVEEVHIVACGTSYNAGLVAQYWLERHSGLPTKVDIASEYRYRQPKVRPGTLFVTVSQSGETADTLAALRLAKDLGYVGSLAICNVAESSLVRESDLTLLTNAGPEIGVASTKAFTTQLTAFLLLTAVLGRQAVDNEDEIVLELHKLSSLMDEVLKLEDRIRDLAGEFADKHHALFLGRGAQYPVAMEGALKLKEISYIHAEAYAAGELKHGPLALVDKDMPVIVVAPGNNLLDKLKSNMEEVRARGGQLYVFGDVEAGFQDEPGVTVIPVPHVDYFIEPIIYTIPLQLLSYYVALIKGTDVDQPRNLAKSVTVE